MAAFEARSVAVRRSNGDEMTIGPVQPSGVLVQPIELDGATLYLDLADPSVPPFVRVSDARRALWWLSFVLGDDVADAVRELVDGVGADHEERAAAEPGLLAGTVLRFGVGLWLYRWWPSGDRDGVPSLTREGERWIKTELGVLGWYAEDAFGDTSSAQVLLSENVGYVIDTASRSHEVHHPLATVRAVIESVPLDDFTYRRLSRIEDALLGSAEAAALLESEFKSLGRSRAVLGAPDHVARTSWVSNEKPNSSEHQVAAGTTTAEWGRVRARLLGAREQNVRWAVAAHPGNAFRVAIRVLTGDGWDGELLYAAVYGEDSRFPDVVVELMPESRASSALFGEAGLSKWSADRAVRVVIFSEDAVAEDTELASSTDDRDLVVTTVLRLLAHGESSSNRDVASYDLEPSDPWRVPGIELSIDVR